MAIQIAARCSPSATRARCAWPRPRCSRPATSLSRDPRDHAADTCYNKVSPDGRYTCLVTAPSSSTGATSTSSPSRNWSSIARAVASFGSSHHTCHRNPQVTFDKSVVVSPPADRSASRPPRSGAPV